MRPSGRPEVRSRFLGKSAEETHAAIGQGPTNGKDGSQKRPQRAEIANYRTVIRRCTRLDLDVYFMSLFQLYHLCHHDSADNVSPSVKQRGGGEEGLGVEVEVGGSLARKKKRNTKTKQA